MTLSRAGYREIEHTADWELEVWAPDMPALLEQAAQGMYALAGVRLRDGPRRRRLLKLSYHDREALLVSFLSELLWLGENDGLAFDQLELRLDEEHLQAELQGAPIASLDKEIKAVTFHKLKIEESAIGLQVKIVFDV